MNKVEYKIIDYQQGLRKRITGDDFGDDFLALLNENGSDGWKLLTVIRESGMNAKLIFCRENDQ